MVPREETPMLDAFAGAGVLLILGSALQRIAALCAMCEEEFGWIAELRIAAPGPRNVLLIAFELECDGAYASTFIGNQDRMDCQDARPLFIVRPLVRKVTAGSISM